MEYVFVPLFKPDTGVLKDLNLVSQCLKLTEEAGELAQKIGILTGESGCRKPVPGDIVKQTAEEVFDVMQTAASALVILQRDYGADALKSWKLHLEKMRERGYCTE